MGAGRAGVVGVEVVSAGTGAALLGGEAALAIEVNLVADLAEYFVADGAEVHLVVASRASFCR